MVKKYTEAVVTCLDCPKYHCPNGSTKDFCYHINAPDDPLNKDEIWNGKFPKWCPLEDWE